MKFRKVSILESKEIQSKKRFGFFSKKQRGRYVALWRESHLTQRAFCQQQGINLSTFNNWLRKEKKTKSQEQPVEMAKWEQTPERLSIESSENHAELWFPNGCYLKFSTHADMKKLSLMVRDLLCKLN